MAVIPPVASTVSVTDSGVERHRCARLVEPEPEFGGGEHAPLLGRDHPDAEVAALFAEALLLGPPVAVVGQLEGLVEHLVVVAGVVDVAGGDEVRELADEVLAADGYRVEAQLAGGLVDHLLEHPVVHLGAEAPVGALLVLVGQRRPHPVPHAGDRVRAGDLGQGVAVMAHAELHVGAVVVDHVDLDAAHGAVPHHRQLDFVDAVGAVVVAVGDVVGPVLQVGHFPAGFPRAHGGDDPWLVGEELGAEAAASRTA